ncbi:hypothetical protein [Streptomyces sp. NPDC050264]|uniref:hypothetical protein n=1 Tax=Streptomyces sp. NPDC050264 TaxID=3155038 RepID=UPI003448757E
MSDMYALDLALELSGATPAPFVDDLRWHLGVADEREADEDEWPLLAGRGPALHAGGALVAELVHASDTWYLTVHQEVHEENLDDVDALLNRLVKHTVREGVIGQLRFYEDAVPDLLINRAGTLAKVALLREAAAEE